MNVRSVALKTDLALAALRGRIIDRGDYLVVETPDDPGYHYGNLLVLPAAPQPGNVARWLERFSEEFRSPAIRHVTLVWDGITADVPATAELLAAGFTLETSLTMVSEHIESRAAALPIRPLTPDEVLATVEIEWAITDRHDDTYRHFLERRAAWHAELVARSAATFWGAHDGTTLVASLGLVSLGSLARYQDVQTLATHRHRGLASALLAAAAQSVHDVEQLVIVATPDSDGARLYSRLGFRTIEVTVSACRRPSD